MTESHFLLLSTQIYNKKTFCVRTQVINLIKKGNYSIVLVEFAKNAQKIIFAKQ
jgi:hypothetical protein